jgi:DNA-binding MarR family transcriptional regulator
MVLDEVGKPIYRSAMKQVDEVAIPLKPKAATHEEGATLFSFLEVADQLFERISEALGKVGLSYAKYEILKHLQDADAPLTLGALAEGQHCARSNITQLVDRLETEGMVRRVDDPVDRRAVRAQLTPVGLSLVQEGSIQIDVVRAQFAAALTTPERVELARLLAKIG